MYCSHETLWSSFIGRFTAWKRTFYNTRRCAIVQLKLKSRNKSYISFSEVIQTLSNYSWPRLRMVLIEFTVQENVAAAWCWIKDFFQPSADVGVRLCLKTDFGSCGFFLFHHHYSQLGACSELYFMTIVQPHVCGDPTAVLVRNQNPTHALILTVICT